MSAVLKRVHEEGPQESDEIAGAADPGFVVDLTKILRDRGSKMSSREDGGDPSDSREEDQPSSSMKTLLADPFLSKRECKKSMHREKEDLSPTESKGSGGSDSLSVNVEGESPSGESRATGKYARRLREESLSRQQRQERLCSLIVFNAGITVRGLMELTGWGESTIWQYLYGRSGYYLGLIDQEKVRTENAGPGRGKETRCFAVISPGSPEGLTKLEMLRTRWARQENERAEEPPS